MAAVSAIHALLIGIDDYEPSRFPDGQPIRPLLGAVNDVARMRRFLQEGPFAVPTERIRELVSPHPWAHRAASGDAELPTRENLVREIRALPDRAAPGDRVLIHYSGHGARLPTAVPEVKGPSARDECLVPCDAGAVGRGFLRDVEVHALLQELAERGLFVTMVLDCCHAGGLTRTGPRTNVRGLGDLPYPPDRQSALGSWSSLTILAPPLRPAAPGPVMRALDPTPGSFPLPVGCAVLAACLPTELAKERVIAGGAVQGVLTHCLAQVLAESTPPYVWGQVHRRVRAAVRGLDPLQTPVLRGDEESELAGDWMPPEMRKAPSRRRASADGDRADGFQGVARTCGPAADLAAAVHTELFALAVVDDWRRRDRRLPVRPGRVPVGSLLCLVVRNDSNRALELAVLDLRPDRTIHRLHPFPGDGDTATLDPGAEVPVFARAELPDGWYEGHDRLKIIVAEGAFTTEPMERPGSGEPCPRALSPGGERWGARSLDLTIVRAIG